MNKPNMPTMSDLAERINREHEACRVVQSDVINLCIVLTQF